MKFFTPRTLLLCFTAAFALSPAARAVTIVNGGFETGDFTGWTVTGPADFTGVDKQSPQSGVYGAYFGSTASPTGLSQSIATTAGTTYQVGFWLKSEFGDTGLATPNAFSFSWNGASVSSLSNLAPGAYTHYTYSLLATGASSTLAFSFRDEPAFFDLDSVAVDGGVVASVPEPSSVLLMAGGGLAMLGYQRRRQKRPAPKPAN